ncbi:V-set and immunoglobulin domain-containing protein 10-like [Austrofundulus limnaeus]|uniref:V-set and immunoglobulin domain-containing protein 10-like n=1 Tax=Austrofundulus limnaeus TaxID=52670 RepID=UPI0006B35F33|nr:PREDICTED: V-set and immunoglobulin domain-containing protein 10-like [Austrofundulus limnaeus]
MKKLEEREKLRAVFLSLFFFLAFQGAECQLVVSPVGPAVLNALSGSNVSLALAYSGAADPVVTWSKGNLIVATWIINSNSTPDIAPDSRTVLRIEPNGSLTFVNVPVSFTGTYTAELTKSGQERFFTTFTLKIFENIQNVNLSTRPSSVIEGTDNFTLQYSMLQGVVEQQTWRFNGREVKNSSRYLKARTSLVILKPNRSDTGLYTLSLTNPFNNVTTQINVPVFYGPDEPIVEVHPALPFYEAGGSLNLSCQAQGFPLPTVEWTFGGQILPHSQQGGLTLTNVQTSQGGVYKCSLLNEVSAEKREKSVTLNVYERPQGSPTCSVLSVNDITLLYQCGWRGGTPQAHLSFPVLSNTSTGTENLSLTVNASASLNKKTVMCLADHPVEQNKCNVTASAPMNFLPSVETTVDPDGKIVVTIGCLSGAFPRAVVSWSRGGEVVVNGTTDQISSNTTQLMIRNYNLSSFLGMPNFTCTCLNPLGRQRGQIQLQGPSISDSSLFQNPNGTIITLTWEVPPTAIVTGFEIQMKGPALLSKSGVSSDTKSSPDGYIFLQQKPASARSADIFPLDPNLTYQFRIIPKARLTEGPPSKIHRIGPGGGLSGPAIAGIAAGIPCSILFLVLLCGLIYLLVYCKNKNRQTRYPISRAVEKAKNTQIQPKPAPRILSGRLKSPPDYNRLHQTPSERSVALPTFVPPTPVRVATTV